MAAMCSRCKKRPAVVFITRMEGNKTTPEGLCINCARELGIKPINDMLAQFNLNEEEIDELNNQMLEMSENLGIPLDPNDMQDGDDNGSGFFPGGAATFPFFGKLMNGGAERQGGNDEGTGGAKTKKNGKNKKRKAINAYCTNLTERARDGKIDKIIGREKEIYRVVQILSRRTKNNPCLIGEPGVGKTAIAEGLALRIVTGDAPARLQEKEIMLLDLTALVAGTQFRGQFESRIKSLIEEVKEDGNIILFIDEIHNLVGTGDAEGSMNAANILKPALSRGEIQVIGATTFNEYRKYIEKDAALERRFQPVSVEEPSISEAVDILIGVRPYYEAYHRVKISDALIKRAVTLSERYITDRFLPDKAIDLLDEACSCASLRNKVEDEMITLRRSINSLRQQEEELEQESETPDYEKLATVKSSLIKSRDRLNELVNAAVDNNVTDDDLARVIELWTGIPAAKVRETDLKRLANLEDRLKEKIIGQDEAVSVISAAIRRSRVNISPRRKPASFIFVGPTGVGKTELVKVLSRELFDTPETLIRLDMSEFMEKHSVSRIVGAPPGYVGYDEAGQLTEKVRRKPYSVILFDEIEKAHPDVMNILLQILDEGRITDAGGRTVNFENTVIVMTSNAGSGIKGGAMGFAKTESAASREKALKALNEFLRPEFISRVDEVVVFSALEKQDYVEIAKLMLNELKESLAGRDITFIYSDDCPAVLAEKSYGGVRGARDLRNAVRRNVEDKIAAAIVDNCDTVISTVDLSVNDGELTVTAM